MVESIYTRLLNHASISQQPVHPLNLIIRPAGVAQSVERVALILSDIPNLKVEGSSPSFGYSYKPAAGFLFALSRTAGRSIFLVCEAWAWRTGSALDLGFAKSTSFWTSACEIFSRWMLSQVISWTSKLLFTGQKRLWC
jgi:hypothetical protein